LELLEMKAQKAGRVPFAARTSKGSQQVRVHTTRRSAGMTLPMNFKTGYFPKTDFLDLNDTLAADLMKRALQVDQNFPGSGGGPAGCFAET